MTCRETKSHTVTVASTIACHLEGDDYRRRLASIGEVAHAALLDHRRDDRSLCLVYAPEAAARVRLMVEEERVCCPFLVIELEATGEAVFVKIKSLGWTRRCSTCCSTTLPPASRPGLSPRCLSARTNRPSRCGEISLLRKHDL